MTFSLCDNYDIIAVCLQGADTDNAISCFDISPAGCMIMPMLKHSGVIATKG